MNHPDERLAFITNDRIQAEPLPGGKIEWLLPADPPTAHRPIMSRLCLEPGQGQGFHRRSGVERILYVLAGQAEQWVNREKRILKTGEMARIAPDVVHATFNPFAQPLTLLSIESGAGNLVDVSRDEPWKSLREEKSSVSSMAKPNHKPAPARRIPAGEPIYWVIENELAGRPGPVKAPWTPATLKAAGFGGIVSLCEAGRTEKIRAAGIKHLPVYRPMILLQDESEREMFLSVMPSVLSFVDRCREAGDAVIVHCHHGFDRTGAVLASYLIAREGLTADEAIARVRAANPDAMSADGYAEAVHTFESLYREHPAIFNQ